MTKTSRERHVAGWDYESAGCAFLELFWGDYRDMPPGFHGDVVFTLVTPDTRAMVRAFAAGTCPGGVLADYLEEHEPTLHAAGGFAHLLAALRS